MIMIMTCDPYIVTPKRVDFHASITKSILPALWKKQNNDETPFIKIMWKSYSFYDYALENLLFTVCEHNY